MANVDLERLYQPTPWYPDDPAVPPPQPDPVPTDQQLQRAADARAAAYAAAGYGDPATEDYCAKVDSNLDRCVIRTIPNSTLFQREDNDVDAVDMHDVAQSSLPDCYLLGPLAAMANTADGRAFLKNAITENKDANGHVTSYTVTLKQPKNSLGRLLGLSRFEDVQVTVAPSFVVGHARERLGDKNEIWPLVIEKAYAQLRGGPNSITEGTAVKDAIPALTGQPSDNRSLNAPFTWLHPFKPDDLRSALSDGKFAVLTTVGSIDAPSNPGGPSPSHGLIGHHAYVVTGTEEHNGELFVKLYNPWGSNGGASTDPAPVPFSELTKWFDCVDIGSVR